MTYSNSQSNTGTCLLTIPAGPGVTWNLTFLSISFAGPSRGPNAKLTVYDGAAVTGTVLYRVSLDQPTGSVGVILEIPLPRDAQGKIGVQALPGNAMNIVVDGFGANLCNVNARLVDGHP